MKTIYGMKNIHIHETTVTTIGIFDGVHRGHRKILALLKERARSANAASCVITFDPHPSKVLHPFKKPPMLISTRHKLNLLAAEGIDTTVLINFTKDFANINPLSFVKDVLVKKMNVKELLVGKNFFFGKKRTGSVKSLRQMGKRFGFRVHAVAPLKSGGKAVSSTRIRRLVMTGRLKDAKRLLGRDISILGTVIKGERRGRVLGFPTANLELHHEAIPPSGVYIVKTKMGSKTYRGILNIGFRPTFKADEREPTVEVHIFGLEKSIYGRDVEVVFLKKIRNERQFKNREHLASRIGRDAYIAKRYFRKA